jgi:hypothetical protein
MGSGTIGWMKALSDKDIEYRRGYGKQYYIRKQLGEIGAVHWRQARRNKLPYCRYCKSRSLYDLLPADGGLLRRICRNCGQSDLYVSGSLPAR